MIPIATKVDEIITDATRLDSGIHRVLPAMLHEIVIRRRNVGLQIAGIRRTAWIGRQGDRLEGRLVLVSGVTFLSRRVVAAVRWIPGRGFDP